MDNSKSSSFILIFLALVIGFTAWLPEEYTILSALFLPVILSFEKKTLVFFSIVFSYYLVASKGIVIGVSQYPGGDMLTGLIIWVSSSSFLALPYLLALKINNKILAWLFISIITFIPPLGFINWVSPFFVGAIIFPGFGFFGYLLIPLVFGLIHKKPIFVVPFILLGAFFLQTPLKEVKNISPIDTNFDIKDKQKNALFRDREVLSKLFNNLKAKGQGVYLFPEGTIEVWTKFTSKVVSKKLKNTGQSLILGVHIQSNDPKGSSDWINAIVYADEKQTKILYEQRQPIPYFMWKLGSGGFKRSLNAPDIVIGDEKYRALICYELVTPYTFFKDVFLKKRPTAILTIGNYSWSRNTNIESIYRKKSKLWSRLMATPVVVATNK